MSAGAQLEIAVKKTVEEINHAAVSRARRGTNILRNSALTVLSQETFGRVYRYGVASVPGATPNPQKGNLRRNWQELPIGVSGGAGGGIRIRIAIRSDMKYSIYQEFGTRYISPRPFRDKIAQKAQPEIAALFANL